MQQHFPRQGMGITEKPHKGENSLVYRVNTNTSLKSPRKVPEKRNKKIYLVVIAIFKRFFLL
jgi:hypothetical protein